MRQILYTVLFALISTGCSLELSAPNAERTPNINEAIDDASLDLGTEVDAQVGNRAPVINSLTAMPTTLESGGTSSIVLDAVDPDGDTLTTMWDVSSLAWTLVNVETMSTDLIAPAREGEVVRVSVVVMDPSGAAAFAEVEVATNGEQCDFGESHCFGDAQCLHARSGVTEFCAGRSCLDIKVAVPESTDGRYWIQPEVEGPIFEANCDMNTNGGGWTEIYVTEPRADGECPDPLQWDAGVSACRRSDDVDQTVLVPTPGLAWSQVRGEIRGFAFESVDGSTQPGATQTEDIAGDGILVALGEPLQLLWAFFLVHDAQNCPCRAGPAAPPVAQEFWACQRFEGNRSGGFWTDVPAFGGTGFDNRSCDLPPGPVAFERTLEEATTEPIAVQFTFDEDRSNEGFALTRLAVLVREHEVCDNIDNDRDGLIDEAGACPSTTLRSCYEILVESQNSGGFVTDGLYWVQVDQALNRQVYCDMTHDEGGWTLVAVCRDSDPGGCYNTDAVGQVMAPSSVQTAKMSDTQIRNILSVGLRQTRGFWRQGFRGDMWAPRTTVIFNEFVDPADWDSVGCGAENRAFKVRKTDRDDLRNERQMWNVSNDAWDNDWADLITSNNSGACLCAANGWSNSGRSSCDEVVWDSECELGPTLREDCGAGGQERANLQLWAR